MSWLFCCPEILSEALSKLEIQKGRRQALAVLLGQVLLGAIVAIACLAGWGARAAVSAATGAGIGIAATALMAFAMLRHGEGASLQRVAWSFFSGWLVKVGFTVAALVVAFGSPKVDPVPLLAAYVTTFLGYWFGAARWGGPRSKQTVGVAD
jgi:F0F1-type ATP synthase assembly protein I